LEQQEGIRPVKAGCWFVDGDDLTGDWSIACLIAPVFTITSIILSFNKIQNGDILEPANQGPPGKWPLNWRERASLYKKW